MTNNMETSPAVKQPASTLNTLIVEERPLTKAALQQLVMEYFPSTRVADTDDPVVALQLAGNESPKIAVISFLLRKQPALVLAQNILRKSPSTKIMLTSMQQCWTQIAAATKAGVAGFVLDTDTPDQIVAAIRAL